MSKSKCMIKNINILLIFSCYYLRNYVIFLKTQNRTDYVIMFRQLSNDVCDIKLHCSRSLFVITERHDVEPHQTLPFRQGLYYAEMPKWLAWYQNWLIINNNARVCKLPADCSHNCQRQRRRRIRAWPSAHSLLLLYTVAEIISLSNKYTE